MSVVNEGIAGNRLLSDCFHCQLRYSPPSGSIRPRRTGLPGVTHIVLLEGINDIGFPEQSWATLSCRSI
jgi:hypothetical protein